MKPLIFGRPTWVTVNLDALTWNLKQVRKLVGPNKKILAVVKADGYGHGSVPCSQQLLDAGADQLGVATVEEGAELRRAGLKVPIVIFGLGQPHEAEAIIRLKLQPTVISWEQANLLNKVGKKLGQSIQIHIKVDTGMGRIGLQAPESLVLIEKLNSLKNIKIVGVYTHFAHADGCDKQLLNHQIKLLHAVTTTIKDQGYHQICIHAANSAAVIESPAAHFDMVRPGLMLYGLYPSQRLKKKVKLKPALSWSTNIIQLKDVPAGTGLSYGHTFVTKRTTRVATLPVGYADGFSRLLSNQGNVLIRGKICPIIGRVCMDMCLVDVTNITGVKVGDEVILIGSKGRLDLSADIMAEKRDTISYEVISTIGKRVPRHYHRSN